MSNNSTPPAALPSSNESQSQPYLEGTATLKVNSSIALDELGPMVVNTDGTLSRIANWQSMTQSEKERTLRILSARNRLRYEKLENELKTSVS